MNAAPLGLLDSGVGGLSVLREIRRELPHESLIYYADQAHLPYGPRSISEIRGFVSDIAAFLLEQGCKMIVIPCNAANAAALHHLRAAYPSVPIIGMEPAIKPAAQNTRTGIIGVITTRATYQGELFASVIDRFAQGIRVETQVCPELVLLAEQGVPDTPATRAILAAYLEPLRTAGIDQLVLGCTHFPFFYQQIRDYLGDAVAIIDPGPAVARQTCRVLNEHGLDAPSDALATTTYYTSGSPDSFRAIITHLIGDPDPCVKSA